MNIKLNNDYTQVCVWEGTFLEESAPKDFEDFIKTEFKTRAQFLEEIETKSDTDKNGKIVKDTGGRRDLFFAVHLEDIGKFAVPRLKAGIRWVEDVLAKENYRSRIYPERVFKYCSWNFEHLEENRINETFCSAYK